MRAEIGVTLYRDKIGTMINAKEMSVEGGVLNFKFRFAQIKFV